MRITDYTIGLHHIGIPTADMEETLIFYTELGFDVILTDKNPNNDKEVNFLRLGDLTIEVYESEGEPAGKTGSIDHISINVNDIRSTYDFIESRGLNNTADEIHFLPFFENGVKYFTIEGPNREKVEFTQTL